MIVDKRLGGAEQVEAAGLKSRLRLDCGMWEKRACLCVYVLVRRSEVK